MDTPTAVSALAALAQASRLNIFRWLVERGPEGAHPGDIATRLELSAATLSFHLKALQHAGLVDAVRSGRNIRYRANFPAMRELLDFLSQNCCGGDASQCATEIAAPVPIVQNGIGNLTQPDGPYPGDTVVKSYNILFLCTGNSARSPMAESIANQLGGGRLHAYSAGSQPTGRIHPMAAQLLHRVGFATDRLTSKSWDIFATGDAPRMDFIITLCDRAAGERCPTWPGHPITAHWNIADPAMATGDDDARQHAFKLAMQAIQQRIALMLALRLDALDRLALETQMSQIGQPPIDKSA